MLVVVVMAVVVLLVTVLVAVVVTAAVCHGMYSPCAHLCQGSGQSLSVALTPSLLLLSVPTPATSPQRHGDSLPQGTFSLRTSMP